MEYPYACEIDIAFPTAELADQTKKVLQVDKEIGDRVNKSFALVAVQADEGKEGSDGAARVLRIRFEATQAKMLRVSVSSFYDYLTVALKCYQEFGTPSSE